MTLYHMMLNLATKLKKKKKTFSDEYNIFTTSADAINGE